MRIERVTADDYARMFPRPSHVFNTVAFNELNSRKCDEVHYLTFLDDRSRARLGIVLGQRDGRLLSPFSAPFGGMESAGAQRPEHYIEAVELLRGYARGLGMPVRIILPPSIYGRDSNISKQYCALLTAGASQVCVDYNYHYALREFESYKSRLWPEVRNKFNRSLREDFAFDTFKSNNPFAIDVVYDIISRNHAALGYPLRMSRDDIVETRDVVDMRFFVVSKEDVPMAGAMVYDTSAGVSQVIYWGDVPEHRHLRPMNYLSYRVAGFYAGLHREALDIGPASSDGVPSLGLCDFKEGFGCRLTPKFTLMLE